MLSSYAVIDWWGLLLKSLDARRNTAKQQTQTRKERNSKVEEAIAKKTGTISRGIKKYCSGCECVQPQKYHSLVHDSLTQAKTINDR